MAVGDKYFFMGDRSVAVASQPILVSDKVICMKYNGGLIHPAIPTVGDTVLLTQTKSGKVVLCSIVYDDSVFVTSAWSRIVAYQYEEVYLGSFDFNWNGIGNVYLSSVADSPLNMQADDGVRVESVAGTLSFDSGVYSTYDGLPNITSICQTGVNSLQIYIYDIWGGWIISSDIYIMAA